jgi:hypothetical protein
MATQKSTPPAPTTKPPASALKKVASLLSLFGVILLLLFWKSFLPGWTLASGDADQLAIERAHHDTLPWGYITRWDPLAGLGASNGPVPQTPGYFLAHVVSASKYSDATYLFHLLLLGLFSYLLLHDLTRNRTAALLGGIWMMLQPQVLSHILPGHIGHLALLGWIPAVFWLLRLAIRTEQWTLWGLTGVVFGVALNSGTVDVAFFWALLIAAYGLFLIVQKQRLLILPQNQVSSTPQGRATPPGEPSGLVPGSLGDLALPKGHAETGVIIERGFITYGRLTRNILLAAVLAVITGYQAIVVVIGLDSRNQPNTVEAHPENPEQARLNKWFWATQWSVPVEELLDCAIPGFFGWGSSNPHNPYRGRVGQTEGFPQHRQGMPNLNDVSIYLGATILLACLLAFYLNRRNPELWFFAIAALLACLFTFGKYAPFYKAFYMLPKMDAMRNPIKWFYLTSFCVGVMGTIGLSQALKHWAHPEKSLRVIPLLLILFLPILVVLGLGGWYLAHIAVDPNAVFWQVPALRQLSQDSLVTGGFIWVLAAGIFAWCLWPRKSGAPGRRVLFPALLIGGVMLGELVYVNRHYLPYKSSNIQVNGGPLADYLNNQPRPFRVKIVGQEPIFQYIRQIMTMYYRWEHIEPIVSRSLDDFTLFSQSLASNPRRLFQLTNVRYIIGPAGFKDPLMKPVQSFTAGPTTVVVYQFTEPLARYYLVPDWKIAPPTERFNHLNDADFDPRTEALVHVSPGALPAPPEKRARQMSCRIDQYRWNYIRLKVEADQPTVLVALDRFDPDWRAFVDGVSVPIHLANGMMRSCWIAQGPHVVEFKLIGPGWRPLLLVLAGWATCLILIVIVMIQRLNSNRRH